MRRVVESADALRARTTPCEMGESGLLPPHRAPLARRTLMPQPAGHSRQVFRYRRDAWTMSSEGIHTRHLLRAAAAAAPPAWHAPLPKHSEFAPIAHLRLFVAGPRAGARRPCSPHSSVYRSGQCHAPPRPRPRPRPINGTPRSRFAPSSCDNSVTNPFERDLPHLSQVSTGP